MTAGLGKIIAIVRVGLGFRVVIVIIKATVSKSRFRA